MHGFCCRSLAVTIVVALTSSACSYHNAHLNFHDLERSGVFVASAPALSADARSFGQIEINQRWFYFLSCSDVAERAVRRLHGEAVARGGNILTKVQFRDRNDWTTSPRCRRNFTYILLIVPMFLPFPQSVRVRGEVVFDPALPQSPSEPPQ